MEDQRSLGEGEPQPILPRPQEPLFLGLLRRQNPMEMSPASIRFMQVTLPVQAKLLGNHTQRSL